MTIVKVKPDIQQLVSESSALTSVENANCLPRSVPAVVLKRLFFSSYKAYYRGCALVELSLIQFNFLFL